MTANQPSDADGREAAARPDRDPTTGAGRRVLRALALPFWNRTENRPRAAWRILAALVLVLGAAIAVASALQSRFSMTTRALLNQAARVALVAALLAVWARYVDRRALSDYGLGLDAASARNLVAGLAIGTGVHALAFVTFLAAGWATLETVGYAGAAALPVPLALLGSVAAFLLVGVWEEGLFRAVFLRNAAEGLGWLSPRTAVLGGWAVSSLVFALVHVNQVTSPAAFAFWLLLGGGLLGVAYVVSGDLWLAIGVHAAYDFAGNTVFGITGVVTDRAPTLFRLSFAGPEVLVGVPGVVNAATAVAGVLAILAWVRWHRGELRVQTALATRTPRE